MLSLTGSISWLHQPCTVNDAISGVMCSKTFPKRYKRYMGSNWCIHSQEKNLHTCNSSRLLPATEVRNLRKRADRPLRAPGGNDTRTDRPSNHDATFVQPVNLPRAMLCPFVRILLALLLTQTTNLHYRDMLVGIRHLS